MVKIFSCITIGDSYSKGPYNLYIMFVLIVFKLEKLWVLSITVDLHSIASKLLFFLLQTKKHMGFPFLVNLVFKVVYSKHENFSFSTQILLWPWDDK